MVGATAIIEDDYPKLILSDKLWRIRFIDMTNVYYMKYILSSKGVREKFSAVSTGTSGSMYNVSMEKFKAVKIPMPPIELQNQFATFVHQTDKSKYRRKIDNIKYIFLFYQLIEKIQIINIFYILKLRNSYERMKNI